MAQEANQTAMRTPSKSRKNRGYQTQALIAADLRESGLYAYAESTGAGRSGRDITGTPGIAIEVKATSAFNPETVMRQAESHCVNGDIPFGVCRQNGQGPASIDNWPTMTRWKHVDGLTSRLGQRATLYHSTVYPRRGFDIRSWIKYAEQESSFGMTEIGILVPRTGAPIDDASCALMRWGDVKKLLRETGIAP